MYTYVKPIFSTEMPIVSLQNLGQSPERSEYGRTKASDTLMESAKKALSNKVSFAFVLATAAEFSGAKIWAYWK